jgi:hypothetical protein
MMKLFLEIFDSRYTDYIINHVPSERDETMQGEFVWSVCNCVVESKEVPYTDLKSIHISIFSSISL